VWATSDLYTPIAAARSALRRCLPRELAYGLAARRSSSAYCSRLMAATGGDGRRRERATARSHCAAELATLQGRIAQTEGELGNARRETIGEREEAAKARIDLAKALLSLEAMPRLEADLAALRESQVFFAWRRICSSPANTYSLS
jgi:hypothetical protein